MKRIYTANSLAEAEAVKSHLASRGVQATVEEDRIAGIPLFPDPSGSYGIYVVKEEDLQHATECVEAFEAKGKAVEEEAWNCDSCGFRIHFRVVKCRGPTCVRYP